MKKNQISMEKRNTGTPVCFFAVHLAIRTFPITLSAKS